MKQVGNAENSKLNGEWAKHVRRWGKKFTSGKRRMNDKKIIEYKIKQIRMINCDR